MLVVKIRSGSEAVIDILVGAENRYGADTDADLMNGAVKHSGPWDAFGVCFELGNNGYGRLSESGQTPCM